MIGLTRHEKASGLTREFICYSTLNLESRENVSMPCVDEQILAELREIKRLLTPAPPAPPAAPKGLIEEFKVFLSQYKVLGLAVAFILGVYLGEIGRASCRERV